MFARRMPPGDQSPGCEAAPDESGWGWWGNGCLLFRLCGEPKAKNGKGGKNGGVSCAKNKS
ncbi:MAG TPA: hypothetical protein EYH05_13320 [Anaerolineae bacterium]|nr:hypothetical protein [Anaerolineae bacterium]